MHNLPQDFIQFALSRQVLKFGSFTLKSGRQSPYFFNAGLFNDGDSTLALARFYAKTIQNAAIAFDMIFGPAYKGIVLAATTAMALAEMGHNVPFAFNRKEAKDHGEGGVLIGAPLRGRVLIIDDVISAGTSVRESVQLIRQAGAEPAGVAIALDRMEKGLQQLSAVEEVEQQFGIPVCAIATLNDMLAYLQQQPSLDSELAAVSVYRQQYGVSHRS